MGLSDALALGLAYGIIAAFAFVMLLLSRATEKSEKRGQR